MIEVSVNPDKSIWPSLCARPQMESSSLEASVRNILDGVREKGDQALKEFTRQFDGVDLKNFGVSEDEIKSSEKSISEELKTAIRAAAANIEKFHTSQRRQEEKIETSPGVVCWRKAVGIERVGIYIPGGSAPLFSTVLMLGIPARLAGCREVILCTPPNKNGSINPAILFAASLTGIKNIFKVGGAQAIGAMAYGTEIIPACYKIFGPGNQYVTAAKQLVLSDGVSIDMPAGPSEVLVLADKTANPSFVAADLLAQAEHGPDSQVVLVSIGSADMDNIQRELEKQVETLPRKEIAKAALRNSRAIVFEDVEKALVFVNTYAPEHLIINTSNAARVAEAIVNAGSVFIGPFTPESAGDYASGTNHTLPTNGFAKSWSGVSLDSFVKYITFQEISEEGINQLGNTVITMAEAEQLDAHSRAVKVRMKK